MEDHWEIDEWLEAAYEDRFISDMDNDDGEWEPEEDEDEDEE